MKVKKVSQAKKLVSLAVEKLRDKLSEEEKGKVEEVVKRLEGAPYKHVMREMDKLKEMVALLEREHGER